MLAFVGKFNPLGGSLTKESIKEKTFFQYFELGRVQPVFLGVEKLIRDSQTVLRPIKDTIGEGPTAFHFPRKEVIEDLTVATNEHEFIIVTGDAGTGKSAVVKRMLHLQYKSAGVLVFRAEQFNKPHLSNVLADMEIPYAVEEVFSCFTLSEDKVVFIDAVEKLLESADSENAFSQFSSLAGEKGIKIIITCRRYAVDLIVQKFGMGSNGLKIFELPLLSVEEVEQISAHFSQLKHAFDNPRIGTLLKRPKYLDFAIRALRASTSDFTVSTIVQFKRKLWDTLICKADYRSGGLPAKREKAFMEIALNRAKEMKLFVRPRAADEEAIELLENDEMIFQDVSHRRYAPAHDLLEDWALQKYVADQYEEYPAVEDFFQSLGNAPAVRRGFRLWIEDTIIEDATGTSNFIKAVLQSSIIEPYWSEELLVALFQSEQSSVFFTLFEKELLQEDGRLFKRCLELIKTTCKRANYEVAEKPVLLPVGSGWREALLFIARHITAFASLRSAILSFIDDWEYRLVFQYPRGSSELEAARDIVLFYIKEVEQENPFWMQYSMDKNLNLLISILYTLAPLAKESIEKLVQRANEKETRGKWQLRSFYKLVVEKLLSGVRTQRLAMVLPDLLIQTAWAHWRYVKPEPNEEESSIASFFNDYLVDDHCWGIEDRHTTFPPGIYKTFVYNLLAFHPLKGVSFIAGFVNYAVAYYVNAKCRYKHKIGQVQLTLNDGRELHQYGGYEFWVAYRGLSVTNYLLECLLQSLEMFLFELAEERTEEGKAALKQFYSYLLGNSNSVMITGVLASVAIAHPKEVEEAMLPIVSLKEMYRWESKRPLDEHSALAIYDQQIPYAQKRRWEWNQLPHRKKYRLGFADFLVDYQISIKTLNEHLHVLFDRMWAEADSGDIVWRKKLTEIDVRKWVITKATDEEQNAFLLQPDYELEIKSFMETGRAKMDLVDRAAGYAQKLSKVYDGKETMDVDLWNEYYNYYSTLKDFDTMHDRPATFAVLGLRDFAEQLTEAQLGWCVGTLSATIGSIVGHINSVYAHQGSYNLLEKDLTLESFHLLFRVVQKEDLNELRFLLLFTVIARFADYEVERLTKYLRQTFALEWPTEAKRLWWGLLRFSQYKKKNTYYYDDPDTVRLGAAREKEFKFLEGLIKSEIEPTVAIGAITFKNAHPHFLFIALCMMPPSQSDAHYQEFLFRFVSLLIKDICVDEDDISFRNKREISHSVTLEVEKCLAEWLLYGEAETAKKVMTTLTNEVYQIQGETLLKKGEVIRFVNSALNMLIYRVDDFTVNSDEGAVLIIDRFWMLWHHLFSIIKGSQKDNFIDALLLDTEYPWGEERDHLPFLNDRSGEYREAIYQLGGNHLQSVLKVLSSIGRKQFLPQGLIWVNDLLRKHPEQEQYLNTSSGEQFIKALYHNHIAGIKKDQRMIGEFITLLNKMVERGNATAFLYREDVITYRMSG